MLQRGTLQAHQAAVRPAGRGHGVYGVGGLGAPAHLMLPLPPPQAKSAEEKRVWTHHIKRLILENHHAIVPQKVRAHTPVSPHFCPGVGDILRCHPLPLTDPRLLPPARPRRPSWRWTCSVSAPCPPLSPCLSLSPIVLLAPRCPHCLLVHHCPPVLPTHPTSTLSPSSTIILTFPAESKSLIIPTALLTPSSPCLPPSPRPLLSSYPPLTPRSFAPHCPHEPNVLDHPSRPPLSPRPPHCPHTPSSLRYPCRPPTPAPLQP